MEVRGTLDPNQALIVVAVHDEALHLGHARPVLITGVGKLAAATSLLGLLGPLAPEKRPRAIWNVGTAGALRDHVEGVHRVGVVRQHDLNGPAIAALTGSDPSPVLHLGDGVTLATGDTFVSSDEQRRALAEHADICDMEGYAVVAAARQLGIRATLIKHVSDRADSEAAKSWVSGVRASSQILGAWLEQHLDEAEEG